MPLRIRRDAGDPQEEFPMVAIRLAAGFLALLLAVTAFSFVLAYWTHGWLARHAEERVSVAGEAGLVELPEE